MTDSIAACQVPRPHHLWPDRGYSYGLENFLFAAARLGLIDRLVWVAPPHVRTGYSRDTFDQWCQMDGVHLTELGSFKKAPGGWIEGRLLGLDITICDYRQLGRISLPSDCLIDIDIDYFVSLPADEAWINPRTVFETLVQSPLSPPLVTISRSVGSGFTPLHYRFLADYLAALWEGRDRDSAHYDRLFQLECRFRAGESTLAACRQEAESHPECAATWLLGMVEPDKEEGAEWYARAASLSAAYRPDLLRSICEIRSRRLSVNLVDVMGLRKRVAEASLDSRQLWMAEVEFGLIYSAFGRLESAIDCYGRATAIGGEHAELALEIARLLVATGRHTPAIDLLRAALEDDKSRTAAHLMLAEIKTTSGLLEEARQHLDEAIASAPAWGQLLDLSALVHQRLGNIERARELQESADEIRRKGELLAEQLR